MRGLVVRDTTALGGLEQLEDLALEILRKLFGVEIPGGLLREGAQHSLVTIRSRVRRGRFPDDDGPSTLVQFFDDLRDLEIDGFIEKKDRERRFERAFF